MKIWFRLAVRELITCRGFSLFFILNIALGLAGFVAVNSFKNSILNYLEQNLQTILTADATISSRMPFTGKERALIDGYFDKTYKRSEGLQFFSMGVTAENNKLVSVVAIDSHYPLYGEISLKNRKKITPELIQKYLIDERKIWVKKDTLIAFNAKIGDSFRLGNKSYVIDDVIENEPAVGVGFGSIAPRVFIAKDSLKDSGLLKPKTRINHVIYLKVASSVDLKALKVDFSKKIFEMPGDDINLRITTYHDANDRLGGLLSRMLGYLNLIAMIALLIAGVGSAYLFRGYFQSRLTQVGILLALGASRNKSYQIIFIQLLILGGVASILTIFLSLFLLPVMPVILAGLIPIEFQFTIPWQTQFSVLFLGTVGSFAFCLPVVVRYKNHHPIGILRNRRDVKKPPEKHWLILSYLPAFLVFWGMASAQSGIYEASIFVGIALFALGIIGLTALLLIKIGERLSSQVPVFLKIALRNLSRQKMSTISCFTAIALGTFLISIIPQVYQGLYDEIKKPEGVQIPALFLFDIQEEQLPDLKVLLRGKKLKLDNISPLINARLREVNGENSNDFFTRLGKKREGSGEFRPSRGIFRLSYRNKMTESETLISGDTFEEYAKSHPDETSFISLDDRFAERYGFKIGDELNFSVQGILISAKIVNLRHVKWNSFQPNFFIIFNSAELQDAPKIFLANIVRSKNLDVSEVQKMITQKFPSISLINVSEALILVIRIAEKMIFAITAIAYLSILGGLSVIFSIARSEAKNRKWEINMMKVLGAKFIDIRKVILFEFILIGFLSTLIGMLFSIALSITVSQYLLSGIWAGSWGINLLTLFAITAVIVFTTQLAVNKIVRQKPWHLLK